MKVSTAQFRVLKATRASNAENRPLVAPKGASGTPFKKLKEGGLLRADEFRGGFWLTPAGCDELARVEGSAPAAKSPAWPVVTSFRELRGAMQDGFDLVQQPQTFKFALKRAEQFSTSEKLCQIAEHASQSQWVMFMCPLPDGSRLYKLTTRAPDSAPATTND